MVQNNMSGIKWVCIITVQNNVYVSVRVNRSEALNIACWLIMLDHQVVRYISFCQLLL